VLFRSRFLGKAKALPLEGCLMPDELIDILEEQTGKKISRANLFNFQKLYFALLAAFSIRKCFYIQHFLLLRDKEGYLPVDKFFDLEGLQGKLDKFRELKSAKHKLASAYLFFWLTVSLLGRKSWFWLKEFIAYGIRFLRGFDLSRLPRKTVLVGFISACDSYSFDYRVALNCGKGAVSLERGVQDNGAQDNLERDRCGMPGNEK
jgi:hypothetical protein